MLPPKQPQLSVALAINTQTYISSLQPLPQAIGFLPCLLPACRHKLLNLLPSSSMPTIPQQLTDLYAGSTHQRLQKACRMHILLRQLTSQSQYTDHSVRSQRNNVTMEKQHCWYNYKYMGGWGWGGGEQHRNEMTQVCGSDKGINWGGGGGGEEQHRNEMT